VNINISFEYTKKTEIERLVDTYINISNSFFQKRRFLLTQEKLDTAHYQVILPDLNYSNIPNFIKITKDLKDIKKYSIMKLRSDHKLFKELKNLDFNLINSERLLEFQNIFINKIDDFGFKLSQIFSNLDVENLNIIVRPTKYGTKGTFTKAIRKENDLTIDFIYLRDDADFYTFTFLIVSAIVMYTNNLEWRDNHWYENTAIVEFLLTQTLISSCYDKNIPILKAIKNTNTLTVKMIVDSNKYYASLGFPIKNILTITTKDKVAFDNEVIRHLSKVDTSILKLFIRSKNTLIRYKQLRVLIAEDVQKVSEWEIEKKIQNIRDRLREYNKNIELIHTAKGQGYILYD